MEVINANSLWRQTVASANRLQVEFHAVQQNNGSYSLSKEMFLI